MATITDGLLSTKNLRPVRSNLTEISKRIAALRDPQALRNRRDRVDLTQGDWRDEVSAVLASVQLALMRSPIPEISARAQMGTLDVTRLSRWPLDWHRDMTCALKIARLAQHTDAAAALISLVDSDCQWWPVPSLADMKLISKAAAAEQRTVDAWMERHRQYWWSWGLLKVAASCVGDGEWDTLLTDRTLLGSHVFYRYRGSGQPGETIVGEKITLELYAVPKANRRQILRMLGASVTRSPTVVAKLKSDSRTDVTHAWVQPNFGHPLTHRQMLGLSAEKSLTYEQLHDPSRMNKDGVTSWIRQVVTEQYDRWCEIVTGAKPQNAPNPWPRKADLVECLHAVPAAKDPLAALRKILAEFGDRPVINGVHRVADGHVKQVISSGLKVIKAEQQFAETLARTSAEA